MTEVDLPKILQYMVSKSGSDVFFHTGARIYMKTANGFAQLGDQLVPGQTEAIVREILTDAKTKHFDEHGEVDFSLSYKGIGRFRGNAFRQRGEVSLVLRHIDVEVPKIEDLGVPLVLKELALERRGLILVVGATGSGKSTTMAAIIDHRNETTGGHILTLEDPIEFVHSHKKSVVAQREIGADTRSFESGMRAAMREAPDVILLGEIRDLDSMEYALKFANTGHLALSTLHANNATMTMERVMGFYSQEDQEAQAMRIAQNLKAIVCQRLVPKKGGGKIPAVEIMINTPYVTDLMQKLEMGALHEAIEKGSNYGMQSFDQCMVKLYFDGMIDEQTAFDYADSKSNVKIKINLAKSGDRVSEMGEDLGLSLTPKDDN
ncbi:PilT/PilU family type 4a pilus ATPase [Solemya velesiana gill symbiont]|uniref:Type IV pili twitching motility protein PilT n=1 Tax=Solemya velesiana gill symbiont TaxID=1918948 RepID=A0A1T2KTV0_9GAMM|nr:PilT/PilU family type 4a pilus ATPase [Solemya velesiana gill symbiont]OOZ36275.1 type IV pili twitching motility protein PilT [Solemya velesiana gill symbiont]